MQFSDIVINPVKPKALFLRWYFSRDYIHIQYEEMQSICFMYSESHSLNSRFTF